MTFDLMPSRPVLQSVSSLASAQSTTPLHQAVTSTHWLVTLSENVPQRTVFRESSQSKHSRQYWHNHSKHDDISDTNTYNQWLKYVGTRGNAVPTPAVLSPKRSPTSNFQKAQGNAKENAKVRWHADYCDDYDSYTHYR